MASVDKVRLDVIPELCAEQVDGEEADKRDRLQRKIEALVACFNVRAYDALASRALEISNEAIAELGATL